MLIRAATPSDTAALGRLGGLLVRQHHAWDPARFIPAEPETEHWYGTFLASQLDRPDVVILVAEQDGRVIGFVYAGLEDTDWMALRGRPAPSTTWWWTPTTGAAGSAAPSSAPPSRPSPGWERRGWCLATAERNEAAQRLFLGAGFRPTMREMTRDWVGTPPGAGLDEPEPPP